MMRSLMFAALLAGSTLHAQETKDQATKELTQDEINKLSEAFGHFIGKNLATPGLNLNIDQVIKGVKDGFAGKPSPMTEEEYQSKMMTLQTQAFKHMGDKNLADAKAYLEKNAKEKNVKEIEPGKLQYLVLQEGTGEAVKEHSSPEIKYTGKFIDDQVFGSSEQSGGPITIPLDQTIPGFSKGIVGMKVGEKRRLFVHPDLGYGMSGQLPPNSLLIFDIEVVKADNPQSKESTQINSGEESEDTSKW